VRKNLARLTAAFLGLATSVRFGYGGLHLASVARVLPGGASFQSNYKWLARFLRCRYFDPSRLAECMLGLILGRQPPGWTLVLVDQTSIGDVEVLNAAIPLEGRAVPVAWASFQYPWTTTQPLSQNLLERYLLAWLAEAAPRSTRLLLVLDRGYARVALVRELNATRQPYIVRAKADVIVRAPLGGKLQRLRLGRLPHRTGLAQRYAHVLYHASQPEPVDVIVYRGPGFQSPWFLIVPPDSEGWLPTEQVVTLYRQRIEIEHCFRDWKSHLGLRGLRLRVDQSQRLLRLLMGFTLAYLVTLLLGQHPEAEKLRACWERPRASPRHGACRLLSVLSLALDWLSDPQRQAQAWQRLGEILLGLARGDGVRLAPLLTG
jgi:hypothetical protein